MQVVVSLFRDWGTGLSKSLYHEAIVALLGGEQQCLQTTETYWNGQRVGRREVYMINGCTAFEISCSREGQRVLFPPVETREEHFPRSYSVGQHSTWLRAISGNQLNRDA